MHRFLALLLIALAMPLLAQDKKPLPPGAIASQTMVANNPCAAQAQAPPPSRTLDVAAAGAGMPKRIGPAGDGKADGVDQRPAVSTGWGEASTEVMNLLTSVHQVTNDEWQQIRSFDRDHSGDPAARFRLRVRLLKQVIAQ
jgi:hypothetical protein